MATRKFPREKNIVLKSMQVNISKSVRRMTERGVEIRTDQIRRQFLDALNT